MKTTLDPANPVAQYFYLRCGIHPAKAPELPKKEIKWNPAEPDAADKFFDTKSIVARWYSR